MHFIIKYCITNYIYIYLYSVFLLLLYLRTTCSNLLPKPFIKDVTIAIGLFTAVVFNQLTSTAIREMVLVPTHSQTTAGPILEDYQSIRFCYSFHLQKQVYQKTQISFQFLSALNFYLKTIFLKCSLQQEEHKCFTVPRISYEGIPFF